MAQETLSPRITLIGMGGMGTPLLPVLSKLKPELVTVWDADTVSEANLINQMYWKPVDVGKLKAIVASKWLCESGIDAKFRARRYTNQPLFDSVVIAAVDSLESRRAIWHGVKESQKTDKRVEFFLDGRLSRDHPFFCQLFTIDTSNPDACEAYEENLAGAEHADSGRRSHDMVPAPIVLSGLIATFIVRWHRRDRLPLPWQTVWDGVGMTLMSFS